MALKTTNKNRRKVEEEKIEKIQKEQSEFTKTFVKYYVWTFCIIAALFFIL